VLDLKPSSEELELVSIPETEFYQGLLERMGEEGLRQRLAREQLLGDRAAPKFRFSGGIADRRMPVRILDRMIRICGLRKRARRNFETIQVIQQDWPIQDLPNGLDGFRILHASDFHLDFDPGLVARLGRAMAGLDYDVACLTGDFFDLVFEPGDIDVGLFDSLLGLFQKPTFGILGNHDILFAAELAEKRGVRMLLNESDSIKIDGSLLTIAGVDDPRLYCNDSCERALSMRDPGAPTVMLAHSPQVYEEASQLEIDLMLSGHTHGGQVTLPGGLVFASRFKCLPEMVSGAWKYRSMSGFTSNGCGGCKLAYRLNAPADIAVHTLRKLP